MNFHSTRGYVLAPASILTKTPTIQRDFFDDVLPEPTLKHITPYVLHDPSYRNREILGVNLVDKNIRDHYAIAGPLYSTFSESQTEFASVHTNTKLLKEHDAVNNVTPHKDMKNKITVEHKSTIFVPAKKESHIKKGSAMMNEKSLYSSMTDFNFKLSKNEPRLKIDCYNHDITKRTNDREVNWETTDNNVVKGLTIENFFLKEDPMKALISVTPGYKSLKGNSDIKPETEGKRRRELINEYGNKELEALISPSKVKRIIDIPDALGNAVNWRLAKLYKNLEASELKTNEDPKIGINDLNEKYLANMKELAPQQITHGSHRRNLSVLLDEKVVESKPVVVKAKYNRSSLPDLKEVNVNCNIENIKLKTKEKRLTQSNCPKCEKRLRINEDSVLVGAKSVKLSKNVSKLMKEIEKVKKRKKELEMMVKEYKKESFELSELSTNELKIALGYRNSIEIKRLRQQTQVEKALQEGDCIKLQQEIKKSVKWKYKDQIKPPLDNKKLTIKDIFKSKELKERLDKELSRLFYKRKGY